MKKINVVFLAMLVSISLLALIMCSGGGASFKTGEFVEFTYPVPDGMITDPAEKKAMIEAKITNLEATNEVYWDELPGDNDTLTKGFQVIWGYIRTGYPAFKGLTKTKSNPNGLDWDEIGEIGYEEMQYAENYGQFARMLTWMGWVLQEGHTYIETRRLSGVRGRTQFRENVPFFNTGHISRIGACYTVTEKEELVISKILSEENPYNFKPGDEIVGFNGIPWEEWYPKLVDSKLPIWRSPASNKDAIRYQLLRSGVANVNLFEKINIKRYGSDKIETMDVVFMPFNVSEYDACADYIGDVEGVKAPELNGNKWELSTYGKTTIDGKNLGYIYVTECPAGYEEFDDVNNWDPYTTEWAKEFNKRIVEMKEDTDGIIIDLRFNSGGRNDPFYLGLSKILDTKEDMGIFSSLGRDSTNPDILALELQEGKRHKLKADPENSYNKPVVVLTGPDCISACDFLMAFFAKFPKDFKIIGMPHNGSFTSLTGEVRTDIGEDIVSRYIPMGAGSYYIDNKNVGDAVNEDEYDLLIRRNFVQEKVWQTKDSIAKGEDRVRQRAVEIIKTWKK